MKNFISNIQTAIIGTLDKENFPFSSYAPYIYDNNRFYIYLSGIATHTKNLQENPHVSLLADSTHKRIPLTKIIASIPVSSLKTS